MDICRNKTTGKYFIYINETGIEEALFVTPNSEIKILKLELFAEPEEESEAYLLKENLITEEQLQRFHEYKKNRSDEELENFIDYFETLSPTDKDRLFKQLQARVDKIKKNNSV